MKRIFGILIAAAMVSVVFSGMAVAGENIMCMGTTSFNGARLTSWVPTRTAQILTDLTGAGGGYGADGGFLYDAGNYATNWADGETTRAIICTAAGETVSVEAVMSTGAGICYMGDDINPVPMVVPTATVGLTTVTLNWANPSDPLIWGYLVYRSNDGGTGYNLIAGTVADMAGQWASNPVTYPRATAVITALTYEDTTGVAGEDYTYAIRYVYAGTNGGVNEGIPTMLHDSDGFSIPTTWTPVYSGYSNLVTYPGGSTPNEVPVLNAADALPDPHNGNTVSEFVTITAAATDADSQPNPLTYEYQLDDSGTWVAFVPPYDLQFPDPYTEGLHSLDVRAYDGEDYSNVIAADFTITDTTAPLAAWDTVPGATAFWTNDIVFTADYEDFSDYSAGYLSWSLNGVPQANIPFVETFVGYGSYIYTLTATIPGGAPLAAGDVITYGGQVTAGSATPQNTALAAGGPITLEDPPVLTDPFPVFGVIELYDGTGGVYTPIPAPDGTPVTIGYYDFGLGAWNTVVTNTVGAFGYYTQDISNVVVGDPGGIEVAAGPFPGYGNMGYNWAPVVAAYAVGGVQIDVTCGIPYEVVITAPLTLSNVVGGTGFPATYVIYDIDGVMAQGYYSFEGQMLWTSSDALFVAPAGRTFDGTASATPGTATDTLTLWTAGAQTIRIGENGLASNDMPSSLGDWGPINIGGVSTPVYLDDWDEITLNVMADFFDWYLISMGWNIVSAPMDPILKGLDGTFDAADALAECFAQTADAALVMATRDAAGTYTVNDLSTTEAAAFDIDSVHGYWIYSEVAADTVVTHSALEYDLVADPTLDDVTTLAGWNLLGFTHNVAWTLTPTASDFCDATIGPGIGAATKIVATQWDYANQVYYSYVVTPTFVMPSRDWVWDFSYSAVPGNGFYLWTEAPIAITFPVDY